MQLDAHDGDAKHPPELLLISEDRFEVMKFAGDESQSWGLDHNSGLHPPHSRGVTSARCTRPCIRLPRRKTPVAVVVHLTLLGVRELHGRPRGVHAQGLALDELV